MGPVSCVILELSRIYTGGGVICASEDTCCWAGLLYTMFISSVHIFFLVLYPPFFIYHSSSGCLHLNLACQGPQKLETLIPGTVRLTDSPVCSWPSLLLPSPWSRPHSLSSPLLCIYLLPFSAFPLESRLTVKVITSHLFSCSLVHPFTHYYVGRWVSIFPFNSPF